MREKERMYRLVSERMNERVRRREKSEREREMSEMSVPEGAAFLA